jgi:two-component system response regulator PilR (NtrC family)
MVKDGLFRQDLYYRINVIDLILPPLRDRAADIPMLTEHMLTKLAGGNKPDISKAAITALQRYRFPGNVRELENILERALALYDGNTIEADDLNLPLVANVDGNGLEHPDYDPAVESLEDYLDNIERKAITTALEENKWNKTAAAKQLGLTFRSFRYRLKKLNMEE